MVRELNDRLLKYRPESISVSCCTLFEQFIRYKRKISKEREKETQAIMNYIIAGIRYFVRMKRLLPIDACCLLKCRIYAGDSCVQSIANCLMAEVDKVRTMCWHIANKRQMSMHIIVFITASSSPSHRSADKHTQTFHLRSQLNQLSS